MHKNTKEILAATTPQIRSIIEQVVIIEREYQHYGKLTGTNKKEIYNRIISCVEKEVNT